MRVGKPVAHYGSSLPAVVLAALGLAPMTRAAPPAGPSIPNSGILLDTVKPVPPLPPKPVGELIEGVPQERAPLKAEAGLHVHLTSVRFSGVTAVPLSVLQDLVRPDIGKDLSFEELDGLAGRVTKLYRERGFFIARAYLPQQELKDGGIEILVLEGHVGNVQVKYTTAGPKISDPVLAGFVKEALPAREAVTIAELERALLLENDLPNLNAHATLVPGASVGTSDLVLEATESGWFSHDTVEADNAGSRYSGTYRFGGSVNVASPAGIGDLLSARILTSFSGFDYGRLSWAAPVTETGLRLGASVTASDYALGGPLVPLGDHGDADVFSVFSVYPIVRSRMFNLYQTVALEDKSLHDDSNAGEISDKRINVASLGLNGDETDGWNGGGLSTFGATLGLGHLSLLSGALDVAADAATARTAGDYHKLALQAMRQQRLADNWVLYGSVNAQFASKNLDSSESMAFGGPSGVRAYPVGEAPADAGILETLELRYNVPMQTPLGALQGQLFFDHGSVKLHEDVWSSYIASGAPDTYDLKSVGLGVNLYRENSLLVSFSAAHKIGSNPDPGLHGEDADGRDLSTRVWLQIVKYW
jgi:hemolysin activation/secretion protein